MALETHGGMNKFLLVGGLHEPQIYCMKHEDGDGGRGPYGVHLSVCLPTHPRTLRVGRHNPWRKADLSGAQLGHFLTM